MNRRTLAVLALFVGFLAVVAFAGPVAGNHDDESTNFSVTPADRTPGASEVTYRLEMTWTAPATGNAGMSDVDEVEFALENANIEGCGEGGFFTGAPYTLAVDRGNGAQELGVSQATWDGNAVEFVLEDGSPEFRVDHTLILVLDGCVTSPGQAGWYRAAGMAAGPAVTEGQNVTLEGTSHYFGLCEGCESDDDARGALGRSPADPTPTPTATATPTETETPTASPTEIDTPTATPTETPTETTTGSTDPTATSAPTATEATEAAGGGQAQQGDGGGETGPPADAEVFGTNPLLIVAVVAVISIAMAALGARRL